jgi:hypothetical protein
MIPAGYVDSIVAWATRPDLDAGAQRQRQTTLFNEHDLLVSGQLGGKAGRTMTHAGAGGKSFTFNENLNTAEKLTVITAVLRRLCLLAPEATPPTVTYATFDRINR